MDTNDTIGKIRAAISNEQWPAVRDELLKLLVGEILEKGHAGEGSAVSFEYVRETLQGLDLQTKVDFLSQRVEILEEHVAALEEHNRIPESVEIRSDPTQYGDVIISDLGFAIPASGGVVTLTEATDIVSLSGSISLRELTTDDAFGPGMSTLTLFDEGIKVQQEKVRGWLQRFL